MKLNEDGTIYLPPEIQNSMDFKPGRALTDENLILINKAHPKTNTSANLIEKMRGKATADLTTDQILKMTRDMQ